MCNVCAVRLQTEGWILEFAFRMTKCLPAQQEPACFVLPFYVTISVTKFQSSGPPACGAGGGGEGRMGRERCVDCGRFDLREMTRSDTFG